jgi:RNA polymerase sigma-70 factor, ECF subfamily
LARSDAELVEAACNGDLASFRELYERHYRMAVGLARSRLSDPHLAEDAAQEAFAVACQRLATLRNGQRFAQWLGTICRRTASRLSRLRVNAEPLDSVPAISASSGDEDESSQQVRSAVDRLPQRLREIVLLHYFSGLSYDEISTTLGISHQSVHGRLQRARRRLANALPQFDRKELPS